MTYIHLVTILPLVVNSLMMGLVFRSNPRRPPNRMFLVFGLILNIWNFAVVMVAIAQSPASAVFWMRIGFAAGSVVLLAFSSLIYSVGERSVSLPRGRIFLTMAVLSFLNLFVSFIPGLVLQVDFPSTLGGLSVPRAKYGWPFFVYGFFFFSNSFYLFQVLWKRLRQTKGLAKAEVQYVLLGVALGVTHVFLCNFLVPFFIKDQLITAFSPLGIIIMNASIAYGIARHRILDISVVIKRAVTNVLVVLAMYGFFLLSISFFNTLFRRVSPAYGFLPIASAILVATMVFVPLRRRILDLMNLRFFKSGYDQEKVVNALESLLYSVGNLQEILQRCLKTIVENTRVKKGVAYFFDEKKFLVVPLASFKLDDASGDYQPHPLPTNLARAITSSRLCLIKEEIERYYPTEQNRALLEEMENLDIEIALPLLIKDKLLGILGFGEKLSETFYTPEDQEVFGRFSHYLSLTIENFLLYTQLQEAKRYQETLLENLPTGVIGVNAEGLVTIFNKEAERITGIVQDRVIGAAYGQQLPGQFQGILTYALQNQAGLRNAEMEFSRNSTVTLLNVSSAAFSDGEGKLLGAQMIFTDVTKIKDLEEEVKRSEKLASFGVMAAGLAHEIKNPLVSIMTFAQLLPTKYQDEEFRKTFTQMAVKEVERINNLLENLLVFARPAPPKIETINLVEVVKSTVLLFSGQLGDKQINLEEHYSAPELMVDADKEKLEQAFLNILLNSRDAIGSRGTIFIDVTGRLEVAVVSIRDTGVGIKKEDLGKIFDPFFTTKQKGTGLGLSLVAGVVSEHHGKVSVESEENRGTTIHVELPLAHQKGRVHEPCARGD